MQHGVIEVFQREYGFASKWEGHDVIATTRVSTCTVWYGHDSARTLGFLCHFDYPWTTDAVPSILDELVALGGSSARYQSWLVGGRCTGPYTWATSTRRRVEEQVTRYQEKFPSTAISVEQADFLSLFCSRGYKLSLSNGKLEEYPRSPQVRSSARDYLCDVAHTLNFWAPMRRAPKSASPAHSPTSSEA